ncbi:MAG: outer membrane beta-barrel protein [Bryobacteraceae bacterium]
MRLGIVVLSLGAMSFLLYVLVALIKESMSPSTKGLKVHWAKFHPARKRGELIQMHHDVLIRKASTKSAERIALSLLIFIGMSISMHGQQPEYGPRPVNSAQAPLAASPANNSQVSQEVLQELDAMKKRIEELEAQLRQKNAGPQSPPPVEPAASAAVVRNELPSTAAPISQGLTAQESAAPAKPQKAEPFAFADWTWLNGNPRTKDVVFDSKFFTPEIRADVAYHYDFNHPKDDTISGSSEVFRSNEVNLTDLGIGGDFHYDHVRARVLSQIGLYSTATPRNDASYARGQWQLDNAYRYVSEAYGGYHLDALHGINVDAGIFLSYVGLFSFYNFDNWAYQPSYVSSNTPWFFTGMRIQIFPTEKLKIEPWIINGWQSYARYNGRLGFGGQVLYRPTSWLSMLTNNYGAGADALGLPNRTRYHTDNSIEVKYYDHPERFLDKMAFSLTGDMGCETGGGVNCTTNKKNAAGQIVAYKQSFLGYMLYNRWWFHKDRYGFTLGGGEINNPGRYLVLLPPIDGATATTGTPYFTENPGDPFKAWDMSATYDYMPSQYITFRWEFNHRHANVPYWNGPGGMTPPGGNNGNPSAVIPGWSPDLRKTEDRATMAILVKF